MKARKKPGVQRKKGVREDTEGKDGSLPVTTLNGVDQDELCLRVTLNTDRRVDIGVQALGKVTPTRGRGRRASPRSAAPPIVAKCVSPSRQYVNNEDCVTIGDGDSPDNSDTGAVRGGRRSRGQGRNSIVLSAPSLSPAHCHSSPAPRKSSPRKSPQKQAGKNKVCAPTELGDVCEDKTVDGVDLTSDLTSHDTRQSPVKANNRVVVARRGRRQSPRAQSRLADIAGKQDTDAPEQGFNNHKVSGKKPGASRKKTAQQETVDRVVSGDGIAMVTNDTDAGADTVMFGDKAQVVTLPTMHQDEGDGCVLPSDAAPSKARQLSRQSSPRGQGRGRGRSSTPPVAGQEVTECVCRGNKVSRVKRGHIVRVAGRGRLKKSMCLQGILPDDVAKIENQRLTEVSKEAVDSMSQCTGHIETAPVLALCTLTRTVPKAPVTVSTSPVTSPVMTCTSAAVVSASPMTSSVMNSVTVSASSQSVTTQLKTHSDTKNTHQGSSRSRADTETAQVSRLCYQKMVHTKAAGRKGPKADGATRNFHLGHHKHTKSYWGDIDHEEDFEPDYEEEEGGEEHAGIGGTSHDAGVESDDSGKDTEHGTTCVVPCQPGDSAVTLGDTEVTRDCNTELGGNDMTVDGELNDTELPVDSVRNDSVDFERNDVGVDSELGDTDDSCQVLSTESPECVTVVSDDESRAVSVTDMSVTTDGDDSMTAYCGQEYDSSEYVVVEMEEISDHGGRRTVMREVSTDVGDAVTQSRHVCDDEVSRDGDHLVVSIDESDRVTEKQPGWTEDSHPDAGVSREDGMCSSGSPRMLESSLVHDEDDPMGGRHVTSHISEHRIDVDLRQSQEHVSSVEASTDGDIAGHLTSDRRWSEDGHSETSSTCSQLGSLSSLTTQQQHQLQGKVRKRCWKRNAAGKTLGTEGCGRKTKITLRRPDRVGSAEGGSCDRSTANVLVSPVCPPLTVTRTNSGQRPNCSTSVTVNRNVSTVAMATDIATTKEPEFSRSVIISGQKCSTLGVTKTPCDTVTKVSTTGLNHSVRNTSTHCKADTSVTSDMLSENKNCVDRQPVVMPTRVPCKRVVTARNPGMKTTTVGLSPLKLPSSGSTSAVTPGGDGSCDLSIVKDERCSPVANPNRTVIVKDLSDSTTDTSSLYRSEVTTDQCQAALATTSLGGRLNKVAAPSRGIAEDHRVAVCKGRTRTVPTGRINRSPEIARVCDTVIPGRQDKCVRTVTQAVPQDSRVIQTVARGDTQDHRMIIQTTQSQRTAPADLVTSEKNTVVRTTVRTDPVSTNEGQFASGPNAGSHQTTVSVGNAIECDSVVKVTTASPVVRRLNRVTKYTSGRTAGRPPPSSNIIKMISMGFRRVDAGQSGTPPVQSKENVLSPQKTPVQSMDKTSVQTSAMTHVSSSDKPQVPNADEMQKQSSEMTNVRCFDNTQVSSSEKTRLQRSNEIQVQSSVKTCVQRLVQKTEVEHLETTHTLRSVKEEVPEPVAEVPSAMPVEVPSVCEVPVSTDAAKVNMSWMEKGTKASSNTRLLDPGTLPAVVDAGQVTSATPAQVTSATPAQVTSATPAQVTSATPAQVTSATPAQVTSATPAQVTSATPAQVTSATPAQVTSATPAQVTSATPAQVTSATPAQVTSATPAQVTSATPAQVTSATPAQVTSATPAQVENEGDKADKSMHLPPGDRTGQTTTNIDEQKKKIWKVWKSRFQSSAPPAAVPSAKSLDGASVGQNGDLVMDSESTVLSGCSVVSMDSEVDRGQGSGSENDTSKSVTVGDKGQAEGVTGSRIFHAEEIDLKTCDYFSALSRCVNTHSNLSSETVSPSKRLADDTEPSHRHDECPSKVLRLSSATDGHQAAGSDQYSSMSGNSYMRTIQMCLNADVMDHSLWDSLALVFRKLLGRHHAIWTEHLVAMVMVIAKDMDKVASRLDQFLLALQRKNIEVAPHLFTDYLGRVGARLVEKCVMDARQEHIYSIITHLHTRSTHVYPDQGNSNSHFMVAKAILDACLQHGDVDMAKKILEENRWLYRDDTTCRRMQLRLCSFTLWQICQLLRESPLRGAAPYVIEMFSFAQFLFVALCQDSVEDAEMLSDYKTLLDLSGIFDELLQGAMEKKVPEVLLEVYSCCIGLTTKDIMDMTLSTHRDIILFLYAHRHCNAKSFQEAVLVANHATVCGLYPEQPKPAVTGCSIRLWTCMSQQEMYLVTYAYLQELKQKIHNNKFIHGAISNMHIVFERLPDEPRYENVFGTITGTVKVHQHRVEQMAQKDFDPPLSGSWLHTSDFKLDATCLEAYLTHTRSSTTNTKAPPNVGMSKRSSSETVDRSSQPGVSSFSRSAAPPSVSPRNQSSLTVTTNQDYGVKSFNQSTLPPSGLSVNRPMQETGQRYNMSKFGRSASSPGVSPGKQPTSVGGVTRGYGGLSRVNQQRQRIGDTSRPRDTTVTGGRDTDNRLRRRPTHWNQPTPSLSPSLPSVLPPGTDFSVPPPVIPTPGGAAKRVQPAAFRHGLDMKRRQLGQSVSATAHLQYTDTGDVSSSYTSDANDTWQSGDMYTETDSSGDNSMTAGHTLVSNRGRTLSMVEPRWNTQISSDENWGTQIRANEKWGTEKQGTNYKGVNNWGTENRGAEKWHTEVQNDERQGREIRSVNNWDAERRDGKHLGTEIRGGKNWDGKNRDEQNWGTEISGEKNWGAEGRDEKNWDTEIRGEKNWGMESRDEKNWGVESRGGKNWGVESRGGESRHDKIIYPGVNHRDSYRSVSRERDASNRSEGNYPTEVGSRGTEVVGRVGRTYASTSWDTDSKSWSEKPFDSTKRWGSVTNSQSETSCYPPTKRGIHRNSWGEKTTDSAAEYGTDVTRWGDKPATIWGGDADSESGISCYPTTRWGADTNSWGEKSRYPPAVWGSDTDIQGETPEYHADDQVTGHNPKVKTSHLRNRYTGTSTSEQCVRTPPVPRSTPDDQGMGRVHSRAPSDGRGEREVTAKVLEAVCDRLQFHVRQTNLTEEKCDIVSGGIVAKFCQKYVTGGQEFSDELFNTLVEFVDDKVAILQS